MFQGLPAVISVVQPRSEELQVKNKTKQKTTYFNKLNSQLISLYTLHRYLAYYSLY